MTCNASPDIASVRFRSLFALTSQHIRLAFAHAKFLGKKKGIKFLWSPQSQTPDYSTALSHGQLLIVVSRACGPAHTRNLFKRRCRAIFFEQRLFTHTGTFIIIASARAMELTFTQLATVMREAVEYAHKEHASHYVSKPRD